MEIDYVDLTGELKTSGVDTQEITVNAVVVHHFGYISSRSTYDQIKDVNAAYVAKGQAFPYTFVIGKEDDNKIYITGFVDRSSWHCSNEFANMDTIPLSFVGNYEEDIPTANQIKKLHQFLLDIKNGEIIGSFNPYEKLQINYGGVVIPSRTTWHNQVALPGYPTACCGRNLIPYIQKIQELGEGVIEVVTPAPNPAPVPIPEPVPQPVIDSRVDELTANVANLTSELAKAREENLLLTKKIDELWLANKLVTDDIKARNDEVQKALELANQKDKEKEELKKLLDAKTELSPITKSIIGLIGKGGIVTLPSIYLAFMQGMTPAEAEILFSRYQPYIIGIGILYLTLRWLKESGSFVVADTDNSIAAKISRAFNNLI